MAMNLKQVTPFYRFLFLLMLSIGLMILDHRTDLFRHARLAASVMTVPFQTLALLPVRAWQQLQRYYPDDSLHRQYTELRRKQLVLESRLQRHEALLAENERLSKLLAVAKTAQHKTLLANIINVGVESFAHRIVIDKGREAGVYPGQPAITPDGVIGQVSQANLKHSVITLITNRDHGIPIQVQRNGLYTIAQGLGTGAQVTVLSLPGQTDIRIGDMLVTSGMGGRFPLGYTVARVTEIIKDANEAFLRVEATATARIRTVKEVLLLWNHHSQLSQAEQRAGGRDQ